MTQDHEVSDLPIIIETFQVTKSTYFPAFNRLCKEVAQARMEANITAMQPEELMKSWTAFGLQAQDQFRQMMQAVVTK